MSTRSTCSCHECRLQNDDVSQDVAQKSSFLNPRAFANTLALVRAALRGDEEVEDTPRTARRASKAFEETKSHVAKFEDLARKYTVSGNTVVGMREARDELVKSDSPRAKRLLQPQCANLLTCVVFAWACKVVHFKVRSCACSSTASIDQFIECRLYAHQTARSVES